MHRIESDQDVLYLEIKSAQRVRHRRDPWRRCVGLYVKG